MPTFDSYLVREEDGTSRFTLEDGSGSILLETAVEIPDTGATGGGRASPLGAVRVFHEDDEAIASVLTLI